MMTAVQGIIAAGTAAYLTRGEATWEKIAFTSNHLFYLVGIASHAAAVEIPYFSFAAKVVFIMTPVVLIESFRQGQVSTPKAEAFGYYFHRFYYVAAVVSTVVLVALGSTAYGVGFFSVMALDMFSRSERVNAYVKKAFEWSAYGAALLTFASYTVKLATLRGGYLMGIVAGLVFLPRICKIIQEVLPMLSLVFNRSFTLEKSWYVKKPIYPWTDDLQMKYTRYIVALVGFIPSSPIGDVATGALMLWLQGLTGKLPHDL